MAFVKDNWLKNLHYGVFGLGSSAYPKFCQFGKTLDTRLFHLGGSRLAAVGLGDELGNQEGAFKVWIKAVFLTACEDLEMRTSNMVMVETINMMGKTAVVDTAEYRWRVMDSTRRELNKALGEVHQAAIQDMTLVSREELHEEPDQARTILVGLVPENLAPVYEPGDHLGVCASNPGEEVAVFKSRLMDPPSAQVPLELERREDRKAPWLPVEGYPKGLCYDELLTFCVDLRSAPSQGNLRTLAEGAKDVKEAAALLHLSKDFPAYQAWCKHPQAPALQHRQHSRPRGRHCQPVRWGGGLLPQVRRAAPGPCL